MRVLFLSSTRIGDAILSTGALRHVLDQWSDARVTIGCGPEAAGIFAAAPRVDEIIPLKKRKRAGHWLELWRRTAPRYWDLILDGRRSAMPWVLPRHRARVMAVKEPGVHTVEQWGRLVGKYPPPDPHIWVQEKHTSAAMQLVPDGAPVLALAPTANWVGKQWLPDRFVETVEAVTGPGGPMTGARIAVFSAPAEVEAAEKVTAPLEAKLGADRLIDLTGRTDLLTAYACLGRAGLFVGNDSALMHLAAASGIPTVGLFGPSREENYGPWGLRTAVARTDLAYDEILAQPGYDHHKPVSWMDTLRVETVIAAVDRLIGGATPTVVSASDQMAAE